MLEYDGRCAEVLIFESASAREKLPWFHGDYVTVLDSVESFIKNGRDANMKGQYDCPLLHLICQNGNAGAASLLLSAGADIRARNRGGAMALHRAVHDGEM